MSGPLAGVRVLDLSRVLAGPSATQVLGDLGADVIKVERPGCGDDARRWGPPWLGDAEGRETAESAYFLAANRNKRSLTLDLAHPQGRALARRLVARADVLVENFRVGALARWGLAHADLAGDFPRLVYCSITGFGQDGPYAGRAGYDIQAQAMGGIMSVTGAADGAPAKVGVAVADLMAGMYAAVAVLAALRHRDLTGEGQHIDISLLDAQVAWLANQATGYLASGVVPPRLGNAHPSIVPYGVFAVADGHIVLAVGNDAQFRRFCRVAERPELAGDARFATNPARVAHRDALAELLRPALAARTRGSWLAALDGADVPAAPVNDIGEVFADPQVRARGMEIAMLHACGGDARLVGSPLRLSATPVSYRHPPPELGGHTDEVLGELGLDAGEIAALRHEGVV